MKGISYGANHSFGHCFLWYRRIRDWRQSISCWCKAALIHWMSHYPQSQVSRSEPLRRPSICFFFVTCLVSGPQSKKPLSEMDQLFDYDGSIAFPLAVCQWYFIWLTASTVVLNYLAQVTCFIIGTVISRTRYGTKCCDSIIEISYWKVFCQLMADRSRFSFKQYRYSVDVLCVIISIGLSTAFHFPLVVREGTAISLFLLSGAISWSRERSFLFFLKTNQSMTLFSKKCLINIHSFGWMFFLIPFIVYNCSVSKKCWEWSKTAQRESWERTEREEFW